MVTHPDRQLDRLRDELETGDRDVTDDEADLLLAFDDRMALLPSEYGSQRREKLLRHCTIVAEGDGNDLAAALEDRDAAEAIVQWIHDEYDPEGTPETNKDYRIALRMFGKRVAEHSRADEFLRRPMGLPGRNRTGHALGSTVDRDLEYRRAGSHREQAIAHVRRVFCGPKAQQMASIAELRKDAGEGDKRLDVDIAVDPAVDVKRAHPPEVSFGHARVKGRVRLGHAGIESACDKPFAPVGIIKAIAKASIQAAPALGVLTHTLGQALVFHCLEKVFLASRKHERATVGLSRHVPRTVGPDGLEPRPAMPAPDKDTINRRAQPPIHRKPRRASAAEPFPHAQPPEPRPRIAP